MHEMMSSRFCFLLYSSRVQGLMDSKPMYKVWQPESAMRRRSSGSLATSVLTWADHRVLIPSAIIPLRIFLVLLLLAAKSSSTMHLASFDTDATYFISFSVASTDLKR